MHRLLQRQLKRAKLIETDLSDDVNIFMQLVEEAYRQFDEEKEILDRSLDISSAELVQRNALMRAVFMALPDVFLWVTRDGVIKDCRGGVKTLFGLEAAGLFSRRVPAPWRNWTVRGSSRRNTSCTPGAGHGTTKPASPA
jgi:hypothetical protein